MIRTTAIFIVASHLFSQQVYSAIILNPVADIETRERSASRGGPIITNQNRAVVVPFAWKGLVYFKFDVSQVSDLSAVTSMTLRAYEATTGQSGSQGGQEDDIIDLYYTNDHSWSETSSFNDVPNHTGILIDRAFHNTGAPSWIEWDMDSYDLVNDSVESTLTLVLENKQQQSNWNHTALVTKETPGPAFWPQLVLEGDVYLVPEPNAICLMLAVAIGFLVCQLNVGQWLVRLLVKVRP